MCAVTDGDPPFTFTWLKDGKQFTDSSAIMIRNFDEYTSTLTIKNLGPEHNGNYTCRVSNAATMNQHSDLLLMQSKIKPNIYYESYLFIYPCICGGVVIYF